MGSGDPKIWAQWLNEIENEDTDIQTFMDDDEIEDTISRAENSDHPVADDNNAVVLFEGNVDVVLVNGE